MGAAGCIRWRSRGSLQRTEQAAPFALSWCPVRTTISRRSSDDDEERDRRAKQSKGGVSSSGVAVRRPRSTSFGAREWQPWVTSNVRLLLLEFSASRIPGFDLALVLRVTGGSSESWLCKLRESHEFSLVPMNPSLPALSTIAEDRFLALSRQIGESLSRASALRSPLLHHGRQYDHLSDCNPKLDAGALLTAEPVRATTKVSGE